MEYWIILLMRHRFCQTFLNPCSTETTITYCYIFYIFVLFIDVYTMKYFSINEHLLRNREHSSITPFTMIQGKYNISLRQKTSFVIVFYSL